MTINLMNYATEFFALIGVGAALATIVPPPYIGVDTPKTIFQKIRATSVYAALYRLLQWCANNVGMAKNFSDPQQFTKLTNLTNAITDLTVKQASETASAIAKNSEAVGAAVTSVTPPKLVGMTALGQPVIEHPNSL